MKPARFKDALEIAAYYLKYPKVLVDWCRARGYNGDFWKSKEKQ
jgi:hypothetical protein